ncbi:MAG: putative H+/amino acid transporter [Gammaproteobacteria bacterium]|nr:putative H+/amino acid transporter [Gammaproteobacteria bacterium]
MSIQLTKFRKNISTFSLVMTGVTAILGSGWLLGTQKIANVAGPAGFLSWIFGAVVALLVSLFYIEIGSANPSSGGIGYYSHVTHGRFCGFLTSWINWLSIVAVAPIEAQGVVQYGSQLSPALNGLYNVPTHALTPLGIVVAIGFMLFFMGINYWSVRLFIYFNNLSALLKLAIPILTIIVLYYEGLHTQNFGNNMQTFMPFGFKSIMMSVVTCGVVMSFNGFQSPLNFSEEIANPKKMLPIAIISSILITFVIYLLLQIVFVGSLSPHMLAQGWGGINLRSPFVDILLLLNLHLMAVGVYATSVISPSATGALFIASSSRILFSLSNEKHLPSFLSQLNPIYYNPRKAIIMSTLLGCVFLFLFKGWYELVAVISVIHLFSYLPAPIIVIANRIKNKSILTNKDQFIMPFARIFAPVLLFILSMLLFSAQWPLTGEMLLLVLPGLGFYTYYEYKNHRGNGFMKAFRGASWLIIYIIAISLIAYYGNNPSIAHQTLSTLGSTVCIAVLSLFTYFYGVYFAIDKSTYQRADTSTAN